MDANTWRTRAQTAMHEQGTLLEIARIILAFSTDLDDLTREIAREIVERHHYHTLAIYLPQSDDSALALAHGARLGSLLEQETSALAARSKTHPQPLILRDDNHWRIAVPIPIQNSPDSQGVLIAAAPGSPADAQHALTLCKALARLIAIGIQNAHLRKPDTQP